MILITGEELDRLPERIQQLQVRVLRKPLDVRAFFQLITEF